MPRDVSAIEQGHVVLPGNRKGRVCPADDAGQFRVEVAGACWLDRLVDAGLIDRDQHDAGTRLAALVRGSQHAAEGHRRLHRPGRSILGIFPRATRREAAGGLAAARSAARRRSAGVPALGRGCCLLGPTPGIHPAAASRAGRHPRDGLRPPTVPPVDGPRAVSRGLRARPRARGRAAKALGTAVARLRAS